MSRILIVLAFHLPSCNIHRWLALPRSRFCIECVSWDFNMSEKQVKRFLKDFLKSKIKLGSFLMIKVSWRLLSHWVGFKQPNGQEIFARRKQQLNSGFEMSRLYICHEERWLFALSNMGQLFKSNKLNRFVFLILETWSLLSYFCSESIWFG